MGFDVRTAELIASGASVAADCPPGIREQTKKADEERISRKSNTTKSPTFIDITREKSFWDKAVLS